MAVDPALFELAKPVEGGLPWPRPACPSCQSGYVGFAKPTEHESYSSASGRTHWAWEPEWINGTFVIQGQCENPDCQQVVHGTGDYEVDFARKRDIRVYDVDSGIGSHVLIERGHCLPGTTGVGTDSHMNILAAVGAFGQRTGDGDIA